MPAWRCTTWMKSAKTSAVPFRTGSTRWKPGPARHPTGLRELDLLEGAAATCWSIERVVHHVRRLEQNTETAVQMHFFGAEQPHQRHHAHPHGADRRVPALNLIAGIIFGMNFEFIPSSTKQTASGGPPAHGRHRHRTGGAVLAQAISGAHR